MIHYLVTEQHSYTMGEYLASWGAPLAGQIQVFRYESLLKPQVHIPFGTWIFSDVDRLSRATQAVAIKLRDQMARDIGKRFRLLNDPARSMHRYELLRTLHERGDNVFDIYRVTEARMPKRYPVFVRHDDHQRVEAQLLDSEAALRQRLDAIVADGIARDDLMVIEFLDTTDARGIYRKYSAFRVGKQIVPRHLMFNTHWWIKDQAEVLSAEQAEEELAYVKTNPHADRLMEIFELARIQYGRIDYALHNGKIQVWEINTNPISLHARHRDNALRLPTQQHFARAYEQALREIGAG